VTAIYHYNYFTSTPDFLNGFDATFPVAPFTNNQGSQISNRNQFSTAWRWNIGTNKSNEIRAGLVSSPVTFFPDLNTALYPQVTTNLGNIRIRPSLNLVSQPLLAFVTQGRNGGIFQLIETFSWSKGRHNITIGGNWTEVIFKDFNASSAVGGVGLGITSDDPASGLFDPANFPGSSSTDRGNAQSLYGMLAGRVTSFSANVFLDIDSRQFTQGVRRLRNVRQTEIAMYIQDSFRLRPNFTVNAGVRWDYQGAPRDNFNMTFRNTGADFGEQIAGISGSLDNLFNPGAGSGPPPGYVLNGDTPWYNRDLNNFAPNLGFAWTPHFENTLWTTLFGGPGRTVLRGGYSVSYTREGLNNWISMAFGNPGFQGDLDAVASASGGPGTFAPGSVSLAAGFIPNVISSPAAFVDNFVLDPVSGQSVNVFNPDLGMPYVQSWSFSIQRELTPSTVVEVRYVGNHGTGLWRQYNLNEPNIFETGFLDEFLLAQNNLAICRANTAACIAAQSAAGASTTTANNYANWGLPGQMPLPIMTAAFTGSTTGAQTNSNFRSGSRVSNLDNGAAGSFANTLSGSLTFWNNIQAAGFPANFWVLNP
ncbi:MAG TPA: hypothetical protein VLD18_13525, partial [Verrucomicrobiae bacterium]|nr:hypothetical protein [Verrucomicrobiae bacterium]